MADKLNKVKVNRNKISHKLQRGHLTELKHVLDEINPMGKLQ